MTLILGYRCADGIVVAADRKMVRGGEAQFDDKIFQLGGVALAFVGLTGLADDFRLALNAEMTRSRLDSLYAAKLVVEDILFELTRRYADRLGEGAGVGVLLGGLEGGTTGRARLYFVHPQGYGELVNYRCAGHGEEYGHTLAKFLHAPDLPVDQNALRAAFVLSYISEDIDMMVGGDPQVVIFRDDKPLMEHVGPSIIEVAKKKAEEAKRNLPTIFGLSLGN